MNRPAVLVSTYTDLTQLYDAEKILTGIVVCVVVEDDESIS
jgi:hypothetical protein